LKEFTVLVRIDLEQPVVFSAAVPEAVALVSLGPWFFIFLVLLRG
jgi:hypothetical protein